jgi:hypothetical protein
MNNPPNIRGSRAAHVQRYLANRAIWPDGIEDTRWPWYTAHKAYWDAMAKKVDDRGRWLDPLDDPCAYPHLHPVGYPEDGVPRRLEGAKTVTKNETKKPVTIKHVTELAAAIEEKKRGRGRPKSEKAMTTAERVAKHRAKGKG